MRILHIIGSMDPLTGGPCQGIRSSSAVLESLDIYREIVCFDSSDASYLGMDSFPIHALGKRQGLWQYNPNLIPWLHDHIHRFDVVVTNGLWTYHGNALRQVLAKLKRHRADKITPIPRWFIMPHGMLDPYFQRAADRRLKAIRNWLYWKLIERHVVEQADGLLFTCETELLMARVTFRPYRPKQEINVGYGIEAPPAYTQAMRQAFLEKCPAVAGEPFLLFLSRIHRKKGIDLLVKAYIAISRQLAISGQILPTLVIAGPGIDTDFGQSVLRIAHQNPDINSRICFPGMLTGDAKWGAFYGCDAFVLPSHQENFGIAVAEALACGKPVLISDQVNIWREIELGEGGLVAPNTLAGTQELLERWLALAPNTKKTMGTNAKATFDQYFAVEPAAKRFWKAIRG
jgi:glycosyltransferase involved in cell wall biosynthesis